MATVQASEHYSYNSINFLCNSSRKLIHSKTTLFRIQFGCYLYLCQMFLISAKNNFILNFHYMLHPVCHPLRQLSRKSTRYMVSWVHNCERSEYKKTGYNLHGYWTSLSNSAPEFHSTSIGIQTLQLPCFLVFPGYSSVVSTLTSLRPHSYRWNLPQADHGETLLAELS
jgi:hypothetical protein